ncbi:gas vesicle protein GvpC [Klebsiella pneumoniae]|nr:gas vesicle protein GvpC [Klebsiella pneumoniae]
MSRLAEWLDDRTRSGREPKVSPGLACQKDTAERMKQGKISAEQLQSAREKDI